MARRAGPPRAALLANSRPAQICRRAATRRWQSAASAAGAGQCARHPCARPCRRGLSLPPRRRSVASDAGQLAGAAREAHFWCRGVALGASGAVRAIGVCALCSACAAPAVATSPGWVAWPAHPRPQLPTPSAKPSPHAPWFLRSWGVTAQPVVPRLFPPFFLFYPRGALPALQRGSSYQLEGFPRLTAHAPARVQPVDRVGHHTATAPAPARSGCAPAGRWGVLAGW